MNPKAKIVVVGMVPVAAFFVDRATKVFARGLIATSGTPMQTGLIDTVVHENYGIIANIPVPIPFIIGTTLIVTAILIAAWIRTLVQGGRRVNKEEQQVEEKGRQAIEPSSHQAGSFHDRSIGLGFIIGGAASNLFDRVTMGYVYDWVLLFGRGAVNAADIMIVMGVALFLIGAHGWSETGARLSLRE